MRRVLGGLALATALVLGSACSEYNDKRGIGDAPADQQPDKAVDVYPMPDQFSNVAVLCVGPNGVYVTTREAAPVVVKDDKNCTEG